MSTATDDDRLAGPARAWLDRLNAQQRAAVTHGERVPGAGYASGPLLVIAGVLSFTAVTLIANACELLKVPSLTCTVSS